MREEEGRKEKGRGREGREGKEIKEGKGGEGWKGRGAPPLLILQFNHRLKGVISNDLE